MSRPGLTMSFKCVLLLLVLATTGCLGQDIGCPFGFNRTEIPPGAVYENNITTYGDLECINYCFPSQFLSDMVRPGAQYCGRVFAEIGTDPIPTWVLNNTRSNNTAEYLKFFITAQVIFANFNNLGLTGLAVTGFCQQAALKLLCRYIFPTCDPAFTIPTYDPICRRACYTLEDFLCKDFFIGLKIAIQNNILDVNTIDPPLCSPLNDTEAGNAPMCISTLDGDEMPSVIQTGDCYSGKGRGYAGTVNVTETGKPCQRWVSGEPHQFLLPPSQYLELEGGHNYCRNPGSKGERPWCFTTDPDTRWEYCNVPKCEDGPQCELYNDNGLCRLYGSIGYDYIYTDTTQYSETDLEGFVSQWLSFLEADPDVTPRCLGLIMDFVCHYYFPSCDLSKTTPQPIEACNEFCEDFDYGECSVVYKEVAIYAKQFGTLPVPNCSTLPSKSNLTSQCYTNIADFSAIVVASEGNVSCYMESDSGLTYKGEVNRTASGRLCLSWDLELPFDVKHITSLLRRDLIGHNHCRNPEQRSDRPWCYTRLESGEVVPENCDVPSCISITGPPTETPTLLPLYVTIIIAVIGGIILFLTIAILVVICCICFRKKKNSDLLMAIDGEYRLKSLDRPVTAMDMTNDHYVTSNGGHNGVGLVPLQYEGIELPQFPRDDIVYIRDLGQGHFGLVVQAEARGITKEEESTTVAVKVLKEGASLQAKQEFFKEASLMHEFAHPNILRLLGVCIEQEPLCMIFEYMELGDLNNFLRKNDPRKMTGSKQNLSSAGIRTEQQISMAVDIAAGLEYLANHHYVHRDMASRNCLVNSKLKVKIADFGLSQDVYSSDYYRLGESSLLPVRWMPPEAIIYGKFTLQSDIWSFGVTMWELFSFGQQPYFSMTNEEVCQYVRAGQVLPCPDNSPQEIYDLMLDCWAMEPSDRPTASELHTGLRRWNPDISASLSLQRTATKQPDYQNFAVVKEFEKDVPPRSSTITGADSDTIPILPDKRRSYTTSEGQPQSPTDTAFTKNLGAVEDEV